MKTFKQLTEVSAFDFVRQKLEKEHGKEKIGRASCRERV